MVLALAMATLVTAQLLVALAPTAVRLDMACVRLAPRRLAQAAAAAVLLVMAQQMVDASVAASVAAVSEAAASGPARVGDAALRVALLVALEDALLFWAFRAWGWLLPRSSRSSLDLDGSGALVVLEPRPTQAEARAETRAGAQAGAQAAKAGESWVLAVCSAAAVLVARPSQWSTACWLALRVLEAYDAFLWESQCQASADEGGECAGTRRAADLQHAAWRPACLLPRVASAAHRDVDLAGCLAVGFSLLERRTARGVGLPFSALALLSLANSFAAVLDKRRLPNTYGFGLSAAALIASRMLPPGPLWSVA